MRRVIHGRNKFPVFEAVFDTTKVGVGSAANQISLVFTSYSTVKIDWGDGISEGVISNTVTHTYSVSGTYKIRIYGDFNMSYETNNVDRAKIIEILDYGNYKGNFSQCVNLISPNSKGKPKEFTTNFLRGTSVTTVKGIQNWELPDDVRNFFFNATKFNDPNISALTIKGNAGSMFGFTSNFNQPLHFGLLTNCTNMFQNSAFNQPLSSASFEKNCLMINMFAGKTPANFNANYLAELYNLMARDFIGKGRTQSNKNFSAGTAKYSSFGSAARAALIADGWTITDGGMI